MQEFQPKSVSFTDAELGYEAFPPPIVPEGLTDKQYDRLKRFEHLIYTAKEFEQRLDAGETIHWGIVNKQGRVAVTHLVIDRPMIFRLRRMAYEMYESDFVGDPTLNELALDITYSSKDAEGRSLSDHEIRELWARE